jgi:hypothetical protein
LFITCCCLPAFLPSFLLSFFPFSAFTLPFISVSLSLPLCCPTYCLFTEASSRPVSSTPVL